MNYFITEIDSNTKIEIPLKFRGYKIKKPCGKGAFASVVKVKDTNTKEVYAAKIIPKKGLKSKEDLTGMINNEISILQIANHPNIIKLYEIIELTTKKNSYVILIEDYCKKGNLFEYINSNSFQNDKERNQIIRQISLQITEAVSHLHSQGIAHCDIKAENVLLDEVDGKLVPKLCDFNLSKFVKNSKNSDRGGSKPYAAPEIFKFQTVDFLKADIWSLGILIYSISEVQYPYKDVEDARRGILNINSKSQKLNRFTSRCLKVNPKKRPTVDDLLNDPYLTLNDENDDYDDVMFEKVNGSVTHLNTSPNLTNAKKIKKGEVILDDDQLPPLSDNDDVDYDLDSELFETVYGYKKNSANLDDSNNDVADDGHTEKTVYKRQKSKVIKNSELTVSHNSESQNLNQNNRYSTDNNNNNNNSDTSSFNLHNSVNENELNDDDDTSEVNLQSGSFEFSLMLELGYDFELQTDHSGSSQTDDNENENDSIEQDDFDDYEIERIESRLCDSIVKYKFEKKKKPKKKGAHTKRKEKKDWNNEIDEA